MLRRFLSGFVIVCLQAASVWALDPARRIAQYGHTAWRMEDGAFNSAPSTIVQTPDGYMWIGTADGVLQFDGVRFVRWTPGHGQRLPNSEVLHLWTTRDGSVWISAVGSLSRWKEHTLRNYFTGSKVVPDALADNNDGTVWRAQSYAPQGTGSLCQVRDTDLRCLGLGDGIPPFIATALLTDRDGTLWVGGDTLLLRWAHGAPTVYRPPGLAGNRGIDGISDLAPSPDGRSVSGYHEGRPRPRPPEIDRRTVAVVRYSSIPRQFPGGVAALRGSRRGPVGRHLFLLYLFASCFRSTKSASSRSRHTSRSSSALTAATPSPAALISACFTCRPTRRPEAGFELSAGAPARVSYKLADASPDQVSPSSHSAGGGSAHLACAGRT